MGVWDRRLRLFVVAPVLVLVGLLVGPGGWVPVLLYVLAGVMAATSVVGSCPLYTLFGIRTCPVDATSDAASMAGRTH